MTLEEWVSLGSAIAQATAAIVIMVLTFFLARYARGATDATERQADVANRALEAANRQAEIADKSLAVAARDAELAQRALRQNDRQARIQSVGLLQLLQPTVQDDAQRGLLTIIEVVNATDAPALDVQAGVYGLGRDDSLFGPVGTSAQIPILAPGDHGQAVVNTHSLRQTPSRGPAEPTVDAGGHPIKPEGGYYSYDKLVIEVEWKSISGAAALVRYVWYANAWDYEHGWRLRDVKIRPWGDESDEVVVSANR
jgi:hypothetical protein